MPPMAVQVSRAELCAQVSRLLTPNAHQQFDALAVDDLAGAALPWYYTQC